MPEPTFKSSYTGQQIEEAIEKALNTVITTEETTVATVGGIEQGTVLTGKTVVEVLTAMLFTGEPSHYVEGETLVIK